ncbi:MAG: alanine dehydrogenase [bacterium]|nr:alanine dehydrogenase [bacterium]
MIIGIPKEIKENEYRCGMIPAGVEYLVEAGHKVYVQKDAGLASAIPDSEYEKAGAKIVVTAKSIYEKADMIIKVKEPQPAEYPMLQPGQIVFTYFHFASSRELTESMLERKIIAVAYETIQLPDGTLPLLTPMSEVAGRLAVVEGAKYLEKPFSGRGILLGGVPGVAPAEVVIIGGGVVGKSAAKIAAGLGANVTILDINIDRLRYLEDIMPKNVVTLHSNVHNLRTAVKHADILIGAVLIPGARAPVLVTKQMVATMKKGAVIVDVSVDQGGCIETCHPTTHSNPTYIVNGVIHYCVANMPGAVPRTSTFALSNSTIPYALALANKGYKQAMFDDPALLKGLNMMNGKLTIKQVADTFKLEYVPREKALKEN